MTARTVVAAVCLLLTVGCGGQSDPGSGQIRSPAASTSLVPAVGATDRGVGGTAAGTAVDHAATSETSIGQGRTADLEPAWVVVAHVTVPTIQPRVAPSPTAEVIAQLANPTEAGGPLAFQAVARPALDPEAERLLRADWIEVQLPVRPNGTTGWVSRSEVTLSANPYRVEIDTAAHQLRVMRDNDLMVETTVGIGTGSTPTPLGRFYIIELLQPAGGPDGPYGPYAFGLSGFSETLTSFAGGDGVIGIHGTNRPDALGTDVSHGCVRVANDVIESLAGLLPLGTPVLIT